MKAKPENLTKARRPIIKPDNLKKKLKIALEKVKDKLPRTEFTSSLNSSADVREQKAIPNKQSIHSKMAKNTAASRTVANRPHKTPDTVVDSKPQAHLSNRTKKNKSKKSKDNSKVGSFDPLGIQKPIDRESIAKASNGAHKSTPNSDGKHTKSKQETRQSVANINVTKNKKSKKSKCNKESEQHNLHGIRESSARVSTPKESGTHSSKSGQTHKQSRKEAPRKEAKAHDSRGVQKTGNSVPVTALNGTTSSNGNKRHEHSKKEKKTTTNGSAPSSRKRKLNPEPVVSKNAFKESDIEDYEQIFNPSKCDSGNDNAKKAEKKPKKKSAKANAPTEWSAIKSTQPPPAETEVDSGDDEDLTVAHCEAADGVSDSDDEDYTLNFFGNSDDEFSSSDDSSDEGEYFYQEDGFNSESEGERFNSQEGDSFSDGEYSDDDTESSSGREYFRNESDSQEDDYYSTGSSFDTADDDYSDEFDVDMNDSMDEDMADRDSLNGENDDLRIAAGTAIVHEVPEEECETLFQDNSQACIIEFGEKVILGCANLSPMAAAVRKSREAESKKAEERDRKLFDERTRKYWNPVPAEPIDANATTMSVKIINCRQNELLNISLEPFAQEPRVKRRRISLCSSAVAFNETIVSTADLTIHQEDLLESEEEQETQHDSEVPKFRTASQENDLDSTFHQTREPDINETEGETSQHLIDSSLANGEDDEIETNNASLLGRKSLINQQKPKFFNSTNSRHVLVLLRNKLYFNGHVHVTLVAGEARIFGYNLIQDKQVDVHSPRGFSLIFVEPLAASDQAIANTKSKSIDQQLEKITADFLAQDIDYLLNNFNADSDALVLLERNRTSTAVHMTERYMKETFVPNINSFNSDSYYYSSEFILHCQLSFRPRSGLIINPDWESVTIRPSSKVFAVGGKSVGKSTFVRYLINANLSKFSEFLLIDLDIGQPEVFLPQTISATVITAPILGPGFLHNIKPAKAILYGDVNVLPSPIKYLHCVMALHEFCRTHEQLKRMPWVINTMGYTRGLGKELICSILRIFSPTDVVQIQGHQQRDNFDWAVRHDAANNCPMEIFKTEMANVPRTCAFSTHFFRSVAHKDNQKTPFAKDIRYAMILSKLGAILKTNSDWLSSVRPYSVSLSDLKVIVPENEIVPPETYAELLNGSLVYLCRKDDGGDSQVSCSGIGIVRAVDKISGKIFLVSSVDGCDLKDVNALAICAIPLPSAVLLNQHSLVRGTVPFVYNTDSFVGSKQVAQRVYKPQGHHKSSNQYFQ